jgi:hypothetical protein
VFEFWPNVLLPLPNGLEVAVVLEPKPPALLVLDPKPAEEEEHAIRYCAARHELAIDLPPPVLLLLLPNPPKPPDWLLLLLEPKENPPPPPKAMVAGSEDLRCCAIFVEVRRNDWCVMGKGDRRKMKNV